MRLCQLAGCAESFFQLAWFESSYSQYAASSVDWCYYWWYLFKIVYSVEKYKYVLSSMVNSNDFRVFANLLQFSHLKRNHKYIVRWEYSFNNLCIHIVARTRKNSKPDKYIMLFVYTDWSFLLLTWVFQCFFFNSHELWCLHVDLTTNIGCYKINKLLSFTNKRDV